MATVTSGWSIESTPVRLTNATRRATALGATAGVPCKGTLHGDYKAWRGRCKQSFREQGEEGRWVAGADVLRRPGAWLELRGVGAPPPPPPKAPAPKRRGL